MNSDLVHPTSVGLAENDARLAVVGKSLEFCPAVLAFR